MNRTYQALLDWRCGGPLRKLFPSCRQSIHNLVCHFTGPRFERACSLLLQSSLLVRQLSAKSLVSGEPEHKLGVQ